MGPRSDPHRTCVVCGKENAHGFQLEFVRRGDGGVESHFHCSAAFEGYPDQLHGGVLPCCSTAP